MGLFQMDCQHSRQIHLLDFVLSATRAMLQALLVTLSRFWAIVQVTAFGEVTC
jgi:hypothetical protein